MPNLQSIYAHLLELGGANSPSDYILPLIGVSLMLLLIPLINRNFHIIYERIEKWALKHFRVIKINSLELILPNRLTKSLIVIAKYMRSAIIVLLVLTSLTLIFNSFPFTRDIVLALFDQLMVILSKIWESFVGYIPNILALIVILTVARFTLKLLRALSDGIKQERIKIMGLHPDLIEPTYQLLRFLVFAFAIVAAYPYIPGSDSPVFRGLSIFAGFLLSLGSTSLVSNVVSGVVLTYTRGLKIGDRVEISSTEGDVIDRNLLVTRIRTIKNVIITIPNSMVLNSHMINYSASAKERGLILNTKVTIGYDVPWRYVHQLLINAALSTHGVLTKPSPFVFQTSLDDSYVSYELNAYTKDPEIMASIYSELHQNIQDKFSEAQIEILSPSYASFRDGNPATIPMEHLHFDYFSKAFKTKTPEDTLPIR